MDEVVWQAYKSSPDEADDEIPQRPGHVSKTAYFHAALFRIVHKTILTFCGSQGKVGSQQMLALYDRYTEWRDDLPDVIGDLEGEPLPHVLFLQ